jgi:uncharacterized protein (TIGR02145 family)
MKKILTSFLGFVLSFNFYSQSPQKMSYQAVIRDNSNSLVTNQTVGLRISIIQGTPAGTSVFVETHTPNSNSNGLITIEIGGGTAVTGTFSTINWANGPYFVKTETDPTGGSSYTITGTSQLLSVPYALYSECLPVSVSPTGDTLTIGCHNVIIPGVSAANVGTSYPAGTVFCSGTPTAVIDVTNPTTGKTWMDRNLGASQVASSSTDVNSYGDLYQWGRRGDGHQCRNSSTTSSLSSSDQASNGNYILATVAPNDWRSPQNTNLWQGVNGVNNPCPNGYRLPTEPELEAERASWNTSNASGAFSSPLKLPASGARSYNDGSIYLVGINGAYWSSTISSTNSRYLGFDSNLAGMDINFRAHGHSVRCIKN